METKANKGELGNGSKYANSRDARQEGEKEMFEEIDMTSPIHSWAKANNMLMEFAGGYNKALYISIEDDLKTINLIYGNHFETHTLDKVPSTYAELLVKAAALYDPQKMEEAEQALNAYPA